MRDSFIFYKSYAEALNELTDKQRLHLLDAIIAYALGNESVTLNGVEKGMFALIRPQLDANNQRYENGCKGAEHGKKGGAPKGNQNARKTTINNGDGVEFQNNRTTPLGLNFKTTEQPQNNPKTTANENVNDNVNVKECAIYVNSYNACARARMDTPSVDEVRKYCHEIGSAVDAQRFVDYYTANGWMVGKNPMRDWKAMVRRWGTLQFGNATSSEAKGINCHEYTNDELNAMFSQITEDDE